MTPSARSSASTSTRRGTSSRQRPQRRCSTATRTKVHVVTKNRYGRERSYYTTFEGVRPYIERRHTEAETDTSRERFEGFMREVPCPACKGTPTQAGLRGGHPRCPGRGRQEHRRGLRAADQRGRRLPPRRSSSPSASARSPSGCSRRSRSGCASCSTSASTTSPSTGPPARCPVARPSASGWPPRSARASSACSTSSTSPRIGLHQRDNHRLIETLVRLKDLGNTLIVVEHDEDTITVADWVVDIGPGAGEHGGQVVHSGHGPGACSTHRDSLTGQYLSGRREIPIPRRTPPADTAVAS